MNRLKIAITLFLSMIIIGTWSLLDLNFKKETLNLHMNSILKNIENEKPKELLMQIEELNKTWWIYEKQLIRYIRHDAIDNISSIMAQLSGLCEYEQWGDLKALLNNAKMMIYHMWESEFPRLLNIL